MEGEFFPPRGKTTSRIICSVPGCESRADKHLTLRFHSFPKANQRYVQVKNMIGNFERINQLNAWMMATKIRKVSPSLKICSKHFKKDDYILPDTLSKVKKLKKTAVPSCCLPTSNGGGKRTIEKFGQARQKHSDGHVNPGMQYADESFAEMDESSSDLTDSAINISFTTSTATRAEADSNSSAPIQTSANVVPSSIVSLVENIGVQVNSDCFTQTFMSLMKNDSDVSTATGIESFDILDTIVRVVKHVHGGEFHHHNSRMTIKDQIIMTYMKLKQNLSYQLLAMMFYCYTAEHCQRIFYDTVKILSHCLKGAIRWPSKKEMKKNFPKCLKGFEDVRVVVGCTEIFIQNPEDFTRQLITYSQYETSQTYKIITGVTPAGNISFISKCYDGRETDTNIFEQTGLVELLEPGDSIMVDRGFLIEKACELNRLKYVRQPFLREKRKFAQEESNLTSKIAAARVHVERSNQRIKAFKILGSMMPVNLVPLLDDIFIVVCGTINMSYRF